MLKILKEGLDSDDWPEHDAAVPFTRLNHIQPLHTIPEEYSRTADLSAQMSLQYSLSRSAGHKRVYDQEKDEEEGGDDNDSAETQDAKRRKDTDSDGSDEDTTEPPNTEVFDWGEDSIMSVHGDGGTESGEEEIQ